MILAGVDRLQDFVNEVSSAWTSGRVAWIVLPVRNDRFVSGIARAELLLSAPQVRPKRLGLAVEPGLAFGDRVRSEGRVGLVGGHARIAFIAIVNEHTILGWIHAVGP